jgi:hypothetical protein
MIASQAAIFSSGPQKPPASDSPNPSDRGERATALKRVAVEKGAPVSTPFARMKILSGLNGSAPRGIRAGGNRRQRLAARIEAMKDSSKVSV